MHQAKVLVRIVVNEVDESSILLLEHQHQQEYQYTIFNVNSFCQNLIISEVSS